MVGFMSIMREWYKKFQKNDAMAILLPFRKPLRVSWISTAFTGTQPLRTFQFMAETDNQDQQQVDILMPSWTLRLEFSTIVRAEAEISSLVYGGPHCRGRR